MNENKIVLAKRLNWLIFLSTFFITTSYAAQALDCDKNSCNGLGDQYYDADDIDIAARAYTKGCDLDDASACYNLARLYAYGEIEESDPLQAIPLYEKGCKLKNNDACTDLGDWYDDEENYSNALVYYDLACALNDGYGCQLQAWIHDNVVTLKNFEKAAALYAKGCKLGNGWSCNNLGYDYMGYDEEPNPFVPVDYTKGIELMTLACDTHGIGSACATLSYAFKEAHGVKKNASESLRYSLKSCEGSDQNYGGGCFNAGVDYEEGNSVNMNFKKASYYFIKGCELDDSSACFYAGVNHDKGVGVKKNRDKAQYFYQRSCDLGDEDGCQKVND